ncbi:hypothetical protein JTB14_013240, partial [Gonioctena quinquepunctata]
RNTPNRRTKLVPGIKPASGDERSGKALIQDGKTALKGIFSTSKKVNRQPTRKARKAGQLQVRKRLREAVDSLQACEEGTTAVVCYFGAERPAPDSEAKSRNYKKTAKCLLVGIKIDR